MTPVTTNRQSMLAPFAVMVALALLTLTVGSGPAPLQADTLSPLEVTDWPVLPESSEGSADPEQLLGHTGVHTLSHSASLTAQEIGRLAFRAPPQRLLSYPALPQAPPRYSITSTA